MDEIGHVGNSSLFTSVYFLFYFCSKVNSELVPCFILRFIKYERAAEDRSLSTVQMCGK